MMHEAMSSLWEALKSQSKCEIILFEIKEEEAAREENEWERIVAMNNLSSSCSGLPSFFLLIELQLSKLLRPKCDYWCWRSRTNGECHSVNASKHPPQLGKKFLCFSMISVSALQSHTASKFGVKEARGSTEMFSLPLRIACSLSSCRDDDIVWGVIVTA